ncbi:MAG: PilZ domain-containing protein [Shewanella sp.]
MDNRRQFSRILFAANASLQQDNHQWQTTIIDLSLNGALVVEPEHFGHTDHPLQLRFILPGSDIALQMTTKLVHHQHGQLGLKCHFIDVDSISHLKRIIELNLGDASLLNRELALFIADHDSGCHSVNPEAHCKR